MNLARLGGARALQWVGLLCATVFLVQMDWGHDGLWFQGDAPRHAATGLFAADMLKALPGAPLDYALAYYARYPVIVPVLYPPLMYLVDGIVFALAGPSPWIAKGVVIASGAALGAYTLLWGRRWIGAAAGWAGPLLMLLPGMLMYANAALPNVPSTALCFAALYHMRRWQDGDGRRHCALYFGLGAAAVLTYYPAAIGLAVALAWSAQARHWRRIWPTLLLVGAALAVIVALGSLLPANLVRNRPSLSALWSATGWTMYLAAMPKLLGYGALVLAPLGCLAASLQPARRPEAIRYALAALTILACLATLPPRDVRYAIPLLPFAVLAVMLGAAACADAARERRGLGAALGLAAAGATALPGPLLTTVETVSGFAPIARYLAAHGAGDAVLYAGRYDGVFAFYMRLEDPQLRRRVAFAHKLLFRADLDAGFQRPERARVARVEEIAPLVAAECGCRWVAFEVRADETLAESERLLRRALDGPGFGHVATFPLQAASAVKVDLYRVTLPIATAPARDLSFPSFGDVKFRHIEPLKQAR